MANKKCKGYFTVEASLVMPLVLGLYILILSAAMLLYNRCVISQDCFLLAMRADRFTWAEESYGEIIYGKEQTAWNPENYVIDRLQKKSRFYIGSSKKNIQCSLEQNSVRIEYDGMGVSIQKLLQRVNPVKIIREERR